MKYPQGSLTDQQARDTFFVVPELDHIYTLALGANGYRSFRAHRQDLHAAGGDLLLIGCGTRMAMVPRDLRTALRADGIVIEPMDTGAAARTYNVLLAEHRPVSAALLAVD